MSEQRFELYSDDYFVGAYDNVTQEKINVLKSIDLLNSLVEENEQLKAKASSWKITCSQEMNEKADLMKQLVSLKKENEELRQFINKGRRLSVKELINNANENELLKKKIKELQEENEYLKKENARFKQMLENLGYKVVIVDE